MQYQPHCLHVRSNVAFSLERGCKCNKHAQFSATKAGICGSAVALRIEAVWYLSWGNDNDDDDGDDEDEGFRDVAAWME